MFTSTLLVHDFITFLLCMPNYIVLHDILCYVCLSYLVHFTSHAMYAHCVHI
uniref:Uncharacterized protein n=1 Tax=Helianthus annuus TaxID=4232 RepID=A0A251TK94_HELAN